MSPLPTYRFSFLVLSLGTLLTFFVSCRKAPKISKTPAIEFLSINATVFLNEDQLVNADSVVLGILFKDGDGDIGRPAAERTDENINFFVDVYRKVNGTFELLVFPGGITFNGHTPLLSPVTAIGPIEGELYYKMIFNHSFSQPQNDTLRFDVKLQDRAGNMSNTVETLPVVIRQTP